MEERGRCIRVTSLVTPQMDTAMVANRVCDFAVGAQASLFQLCNRVMGNLVSVVAMVLGR